VSGEGVTELLRAAWAEVRKTRGEIAIVDDQEVPIESPGGWQP
jgi:GTP-binding protein